MKRLLYKAFTILCTVLLASACSEDMFDSIRGRSGEKVTLRLNYQQLTPKVIQNTRATAAENALNNLQIFVFDGGGNLKGYRYITHNASAADDTNLDQNGKMKEVEIKTTTGESYIYAVANAPTAIYKLKSKADDDKTGRPDVPTSSAWSEDDAQAGKIKFTLNDLKETKFLRNADQFDITESNFMMSGCANNGNPCTIVDDGNEYASISSPTAEDDQLIKLYRVVSKISFTIGNVTENKYTKNDVEYTETNISFTPTSYRFYKVPREGGLINGTVIPAADFENTEEYAYTTQSKNAFEVYLPENKQNANIPAGAAITKWDDRETDKTELKDGEKVFDNAPADATYVELKGTYSSTVQESGGSSYNRSANVTYYIHLGDFGTPSAPRNDNKDFNVERNCHYIYKVTVKGVSSIIVEAKKETGYQYGAEGVVLDTSSGKLFTLDSHYEQVNMTFSKKEIQELVTAGKGYMFQVHDLDGTSDIITVKGNTTAEEISAKLNKTHYDWVEFVEGKNQFYPKPNDTSKPKKKLLTVLKELYDKRNDNSFWDNDGTKTYTCFVNENYYEDRKWSEYCNISPRTLYIANNVTVSTDGRSTYLTLKYGLSQYSIQTFYNKSKADGNKFVAYGCETIRDDNRQYNQNGNSTEYTGFDHEANKLELTASTPNGSDDWDGLANMKQDVTVKKWSEITYSDAKQACMSRNRDLDGNGTISDDEMRWYCPAMAQYGGLWIGENAINVVQARLYLGDTKELDDPNGNYNNRTNAEHYYSNTKYKEVFWAEEGMATGAYSNGDQKLKYIRCVRNLQSNGKALTKADKYYGYKDNVIDLSNIDESALRTSYQTTELPEHNERSGTVSNARIKFTVATNATDERGTKKGFVTGTSTICSNYSQNTNKTDKGTWRAPNQRELCLMFIVGAFNDDSNQNKWNQLYGCRTIFSGAYREDGTNGLRYSWRYGRSMVDMGAYDPDAEDYDDMYYYLRCVKDAQ